MALTRKLVYTFIFTTNHFRVSDAQREREREERVTDSPKTDRIPALAPPYISHHHRDRITTEDRSTEDRITPDQSHPTEIASPPKTDPPKTNLIGAVVTHDWSHRPLVVTHNRSCHPLDLVVTHDKSRLNLITHDRSRRPWPMTDLSLSLNFLSLSLPPSPSLIELWSLMNGFVLIFVVFFKFIYWNFLL